MILILMILILIKYMKSKGKRYTARKEYWCCGSTGHICLLCECRQGKDTNSVNTLKQEKDVRGNHVNWKIDEYIL